MNRGWKAHVVPLVAILLSFVATAILLPQMPDPVPIHWNAAGQPDNFAPRMWGAFLLPMSALGVYLLFLIIPSLDPKRANYEKFADTYHLLRIAFVLYLVFLQGVTLYSIVAGDDELNTNLVLVGVGLLFALIGNYMPRMRSNWFVGIRTPWTLSDPEVWRRTHRFGGQVFVGAGLLMALAAFLPPNWELAVLLIAIGVMAIVPVAYSYWLFRQMENQGFSQSDEGG